MQAQLIVEQYAAVSLEARELWRNIRRTHPGARAKIHPEWQNFEEVRGLRGVLANQIYQNPILHRPFLKEAAEHLERGAGGSHQKISYGMGTIKAQAEAHQSKMLQEEILKDNSNPNKQEMLKTLLGYTDARDISGSIWKEVKPKLKQFEGTLLKESFSKAITEYTEMRMIRDGLASKIVESRKIYEVLAEQVGIKLDFERLCDQSIQATKDILFKTYQSNEEVSKKLQAAFEINSLIKLESENNKKTTISQVYHNGLQPKDITRDAMEYQKMKVFEGLKTDSERSLFLLLDEYDAKCHKASQIYTQCINETQAKDDFKKEQTWKSTHYPAYQSACEARNELSLEIGIRDQGQVMAMAEAMGIKLKDIERQQIFSRHEETPQIPSNQKIEDTPLNVLQKISYLEKKTELAAKEFITLCEKFERTAWKDPQRKAIDATLSNLAEVYSKDERFKETIQNSESKAACRRIELEVLLQQRSLNRSMGPDL